jgi:receptor-type tyrosine-protein phosphatase F
MPTVGFYEACNFSFYFDQFKHFSLTGPMSGPVQVKTQQGVPSQPSNFRAIDIGETAVTLQWSKPSHSGDNIVHYELYWNDTYANEQHHQ